jgi:hypothetical protein
MVASALLFKVLTLNLFTALKKVVILLKMMKLVRILLQFRPVQPQVWRCDKRCMDGGFICVHYSGYFDHT